jgi:hypothetical protein
MDDYEARRNRRKLFESLTRRLQAFYGRLKDDFGKYAETDLERAERDARDRQNRNDERRADSA